MMFNKDVLDQSLHGIGIRETGGIFAELKAAYEHPSRHYHSQDHVIDCLKQFEPYRHLSFHGEEIEVAIWFHDAIYDTKRKDNEEKSALWARDYLESKGVNGDVVERISQLILITKTHEHLSGIDQCLMVDADLAILGQSPDVFDRYHKAVRKEYGWVPEEDYQKGRTAALKAFLDRDTIYHTEEFLNKYEEQARRNISRILNKEAMP